MEGRVRFPLLISLTLLVSVIIGCGSGSGGDGGGSSTTSTIAVSWIENSESGVNSAGGGYKVYHSTTSGFSVSGAGFVDVPYVSGPIAPTTANLSLATGTHYIKVVAYSALNPSGSPASTQIAVTVP
jgi:hypothetical protein